MLRRHFMTKVGYTPNIIVKYHADKKIHLFNDDNVNKIEQEIYIYLIPYGTSNVISNTVLVNNNFDYGIGYWQIYSQICKVDNINSSEYGKKLIGLFCESNNSTTFYENDEYITYMNMNINTLEDEDVYFICGYFKSLNLNKLILPNNLLYFTSANPFDETNLQKIIIPPNVNIDSNNSYFKNKYDEYIDVIFTSYEVPKLGHHYGDVIKCPPNLVDKYKEYYPDAVAANNILYIKKVTRDTDKNINFNSDRDVDNELYITKNYTDDGYTEINIINYDDFKSNNSNIAIYLDNGDVGNIDYNYITEIILPNSITTLIPSFIGSNITKLTIPKNVTKINTHWNYFCILEENFINLSSATIPYEFQQWIIKNGKEENNCVINEYNQLVFVRGTINRRIIIPDYVTEFYKAPLYGADIDYVFISKNITNTTSFAYTKCIIEVSKENKIYDSRDNCNAMIETATNKLVKGNSISTIPDSVEIIGNYAFDRSGFAENYILNLKNVKIIESYAFSESSYNNILYIPKTLELFYGNSFDSCYISKVSVDKENSIYNDYNDSNIVVETATNTLIFVANYDNKNIVIPNGIKIINTKAICQWYTNDTIFIPKSVVELKDYIFGFYNNPKDIIYEGNIEEWNNINKTSNWYSPYYIDSYTIHCSDGDIIINK